VAVTNAERVQRALGVVAQGLEPFVDQRLTQRVGAEWPAEVARDGRVAANAKQDAHFLLRALIHFWRDAFADTLGHSGRSWVGELLDARNRWAHNETFSSDQTYRVLDTAQLLLNAVNAGELSHEVDSMRHELLRARYAEEERSVRRRRSSTAVEGQPAAGLKPWREVVTPHPDVASGNYQQAEFAADLHQVWRGDATPEYGDAREFFRRTFLTDGLSNLLVNGVRRLRGEGGNPIVEMQTNFGGGKTHSLIALYHLASGHPSAELPGVEEMLAAANVGAPPKANVAVLVGQKIQPGKVHVKDDGTEVRTLWGELAWQLDGKQAYALVADADRTGTNPGFALTELFRAYAPCLILIDEWVAYARQLYGQDGLPAGSFDAQFTFAQALTDAAREVPDALLVVSIPASDIEVGGEGGRQALTRILNVVGRMETSWTPATADEGFEIVRRRLFEAVAPELERERDAVVHRFGELYRAQRGEFPSECAEGEYERRLKASYPIHPELFDRLYGEWSTLERFQRTRGVLRLMATVIYELWRRDDRSLLILPGTLPLDASPVVAELTNYLEEAWTPVIATDVDGENALPQRLDDDNPTFGRYSAARRVARTVFMGSAPVREAANRGLDDRRIKLGCVQPGESPATFGDALRRLANQALYLSSDGQRYWYSLQQTVTRLAEDRAALVRADEVDEEIRRRLRGEGEKGDFHAVHAAPTRTTDVPDEPEARLVIFGPEHAHASKAEDSAARKFAKQVLDERSGGPRLHRNMLVFLAADAARLEELRDAVRRHLAWASITREQDSLNLDTVQRAQVVSRAREWDDAVTQRIGETYQWLLVPSALSGDPEVRWDVTRATASEPLAKRAAKKLRDDGVLLPVYGGALLRMDLDKIPLWPDAHVEVRQLWGYFSQYLYLSRLRDSLVLLRSIEDGVSLLTWESDGFAYAEVYDDEKKRYVGLRAGEQFTLGTLGGVLVKPEVARAQIEAEKQAVDQTPEDVGGGDASSTDVADDVAEPKGNGKPTRFYGSVHLSPVRLGRDAGEIAEAVVQHLASLLGSDVEIRLDIQAKIPDGAPDEVVRTVTENARTLKFDQHGFERD
jgi:predicted AAA+ superfamily ATPase